MIGRFNGAGWIDRSVSKSLAFELIRIASVNGVQSQICQNEFTNHRVFSAKFANLSFVLGINKI